MTCLMATWLPGPARGATITWDALSGANGTTEDGPGTWNTTLDNWTINGGVSNQLFVAGDNVTFGAGGAGGLISMGTNITAGTLTFAGTSGGTYTISPLAAETITINGGIVANETASITANTILGGAQSWTIAAAKLLTISGTVANGTNLLTIDGAGDTTITGIIGNGSGGVTQSGVGTLRLSGVNTYTGTTTVSSGILRVAPISGSASPPRRARLKHSARGTKRV